MSKIDLNLKITHICLFLLIIMLGVSGCGRIQNERFTGTAEELPPDVTFELELVDSASLNTAQAAELSISLTQKGEPVTGATIEVEGNMNHAGMEPVLVGAEEVEPGQYRATVNWTMGGGWFLTARTTLPDGTQIEKVIDNLQVNSE